jgi:hypothetical protein
MQPVESFKSSGEKGYSEYWRKNKSPIESRELANVLLALRKVSSYLGRNPREREIVWRGMALKDTAIVLDPIPYMGKYPVPAAKMDIGIGCMIHEVYRKSEWSDRAKTAFQQQFAVPASYVRKFDLFFDTAERIYVDLILNESVLGLYGEQFRKREIQKNRIEYLDYPTTKGLLYLWWHCVGDRSGPHVCKDEVLKSSREIADRDLLENFYLKPLVLLCSAVPDIVKNCIPHASVMQRSDCRVSIYGKLWSALLPYIKRWRDEAVSLQLTIQDNNGDKRLPNDADDSPDETRIIYMADKIQRVMSKECLLDFTQNIKDNVINKEKVITTLKSGFSIPRKISPDPALQARLQRIVASASKRRTVVVNRGLKSGSIDRKRLYRALLKGDAFLRKEKRFELENHIILLVDASFSMAFKWDAAEMAATLLFEAVTRCHGNIIGFAYSGTASGSVLSEITKSGNTLFSVAPMGKTASGEAIIAAAMIATDQALRKPLILHITDSGSNWGCGVEDAVRYCSKRKIGLFCLCYGCKKEERDTIKREYGGSVAFIENNQELPKIVKGILR